MKLPTSCPFTVSASMYLRIVIPTLWIFWACWWVIYMETYAR